MPTSDHVDSRRLRSDWEGNGRSDLGPRSGQGQRRKRRRGVAIDLKDTTNPILSPIMNHLPSLPGIGMTSLKGILPTSPTKQSAALTASLPKAGQSSSRSVDPGKAVWQEGDLEDGRGKVPLLLLSSRTHALQIFALYNNVIPDDPHVPETFPAPEEVISIPTIRYDGRTKRSRVDGTGTPSEQGKEQVLSMRLLERGRAESHQHAHGHGPLVLIATISHASPRSSSGALALVVLDLRTGGAVRRVELGVGSAAAVYASSNVIAVSVSHPTSIIHLFDPKTYDPLPSSPIDGLPCDPRTALPVMAVSGRLLAFATSEAPHAPGADGLGTIITSSSFHTSSARSSSSSADRSQRPSPSGMEQTQAALITSAVEIGGGVARGVWAGLKMGAQAANRARNTRLAKSAPTDSTGVLADGEGDGHLESESRSLDDSSVLDDIPAPSPPVGGQWIKVVDLFPRRGGSAKTRQVKRSYSTSKRPSSSPTEPHNGEELSTYETVAHFRLPYSSIALPLDTHRASRRISNDRLSPVSHVSFSPDGNQLFAAPSDGKSFHVIEIHPAGIVKGEMRSQVKGQAWHLYELRRGHTAAHVRDVSWDAHGRWIGVGTGKGTFHVFPTNPSGGTPSALTHATDKVVNPIQLHPLSTVVSPVARLRPRRLPTEAHERGLGIPAVSQGGAVFGFNLYRCHPQSKSTYCQDITIYRPATSTLEMTRLSLQRLSHSERSLTSPPSGAAALQRRGSALTEMMKTKAFGEQSDLGCEAGIKAAWGLPAGVDEEGLLPLPSSSFESRYMEDRGSQSRSLARAEIRTHSASRRLLPASIYLSRQVDFFAARPIDEYTPLSILDIEARQYRLVFRPEVEARPFSPEVKSFDEPLLSALHSVIDERPRHQIPGLPNGHPGGGRRWPLPSSIPIRSVTAGLNEGVDRVRREYARAQHIRTKRRSHAYSHGDGNDKLVDLGNGNSLSFEEDAVFPSLSSDGDGEQDADGDGEIDSASSPSSGLLHTTNTEPSEDDEWSAEWEEEYRKAVEDDGPPDELVLGLMDEEEEERRKWDLRRERLKKEAMRL